MMRRILISGIGTRYPESPMAVELWSDAGGRAFGATGADWALALPLTAMTRRASTPTAQMSAPLHVTRKRFPRATFETADLRSGVVCGLMARILMTKRPLIALIF